MKSYKYLYLVTGLLVIVIDRLTKFFALDKFQKEFIVNKFISFELLFNRGISWGLYNSSNNIIFWFLTALIFMFTCFLGYYTFFRYKHNNFVIGEILVLSGSIANIIDRIFYSGVIDFIIIWIGSWPFPAFNIADCAIVIGVCCMFFELYKNETAAAY